MQSYVEAEDFITACYAELGRDSWQREERLTAIRTEIARQGTYTHTFDELEHGARMAWRNSNRCIGRLFWQSLKVFDAREAHQPTEVLAAVYRHIQYATNESKIHPTITVFNPKVRIWNHQLIRYAGYETENGVVGDAHSLRFTQVCQQLGWQGKGTPFDVLPLVFQVGETAPQWFTIPQELVLEVTIHHPDLPGFDKLGLRWYAVPMIADMALELGGVRYPAAPFNGWYMETEIAARNLADVQRYNKLPEVARVMGLDSRNDASLWKDKALLELNIAVLHSFKQHGVTMVDHHTAAKQFARFEQLETDAGRKITGDWSWLIPPVSPATTHIFHREYKNTIVKPNYFRQDQPY